MSMMERPSVSVLADGGKCWENTFDSFYLKAYVPANDLDGQTNNYTFRAPLLLIFEEKRNTMEEAVAFAESTGLAAVAAENDASVLFIYPTCEGGWEKAPQSLYADVIAEVRLDPVFEDGICEVHNFFRKTFDGYFIKGSIFRADIYSFGASADYVAKNLLKTQQGQYLWGPGEITPAMCSMEGLSVKPEVERKDIAILSVGNSAETNAAFEGCEHLLIRDKADYPADFKAFVRKFKMWCGNQEIEPDFDELSMTIEPGCVEVKTSKNNVGRYKDTESHKVGYFAFYNNDLFDKGPAPLLIGLHGGGDSAFFLTFVSGWWELCHRYNFLYVAIDNHLDVPAEEVMQVLEAVKKRYSVDVHRIYASGFSMGSGKTWDLFAEYPETFAGLAPCSALFPVKNNVWAPNQYDTINRSVPVPVFYSGGELSPLPELPFQGDTCLERMQYALEVNRCKKQNNCIYEDKANWEHPFWGISGDREEKFFDESRGGTLTVQYFDSEDGVCRTAFAGVDNQQHECRHHSIEVAWNFISKFTR